MLVIELLNACVGLQTLNTGSLFYATLNSLAYFYMVRKGLISPDSSSVHESLVLDLSYTRFTSAYLLGFLQFDVILWVFVNNSCMHYCYSQYPGNDRHSFVTIFMQLCFTGLFLGRLHIYNQPHPNPCINVPDHWPLLCSPLHCLCTLGKPYSLTIIHNCYLGVSFMFLSFGTLSFSLHLMFLG